MLCCAWTSHSASPPLGNCAKFWPIWQNGRAAADNSTEYSAARSRCSAALERASGEPVRHFGCIGLGSSGAAGYRVATLAAEARVGGVAARATPCRPVGAEKRHKKRRKKSPTLKENHYLRGSR